MPPDESLTTHWRIEMNTIKTRRFGKKQFGQGMTEYIIIVALIAIAAIGVYGAFGHTVKNQVAGIAGGLAGSNALATQGVQQANQTAGRARTEANRANGLDNYNAGVSQQ
jgi:pilus assembly protein Flp/PilA